MRKGVEGADDAPHERGSRCRVYLNALVLHSDGIETPFCPKLAKSLEADFYVTMWDSFASLIHGRGTQTPGL